MPFALIYGIILGVFIAAGAAISGSWGALGGAALFFALGTAIVVTLNRRDRRLHPGKYYYIPR